MNTGERLLRECQAGCEHGKKRYLYQRMLPHAVVERHHTCLECGIELVETVPIGQPGKVEPKPAGCSDHKWVPLPLTSERVCRECGTREEVNPYPREQTAMGLMEALDRDLARRQQNTKPHVGTREWLDTNGFEHRPTVTCGCERCTETGERLAAELEAHRVAR